jgi:hypothetical protein
MKGWSDKMNKYRTKLQIVEAEQYKPVMEDGFQCLIDGCSLWNGIDDCKKCRNNVPHINGEILIFLDSYIIKDSFGRIIMNKEEFESKMN